MQAIATHGVVAWSQDGHCTRVQSVTGRIWGPFRKHDDEFRDATLVKPPLHAVSTHAPIAQMPPMETIEKKITVDGKTVRIRVMEDGEGGWLLEVVDPYGNSTCWQEPFETTTEAFDDAISAIEQEGIDTFIGSAEAVKH